MFIKRVRIPVSYIGLLAVLATAVVFVLSLYPGTAVASTGINQELSFEGKITSSTGTNITDGNYNVEFQIWNGASCNPSTGSGCTAVWTEDYLTSNGTYGTTVPVAFTSGTFQVNLGSICSLGGGSCEGNSNSAVNFNSYPLYVSINVGTTSVCSAGFSSCGGGTGVMYPLIALTSSPYSFNSNELGGIASTGYIQTNPTSSQTIQPTTNVSSLIVEQNNSGSFANDVFDVQGSSGSADDFLQVTSTAANAGAVTVQSLGSNTLSLQSGGGINIDTNNVANTLQIGNTANAVAQTIDIGNNTTASSTDTLNLGSLVGTSATTINGGVNGSNATITVQTGNGGVITVGSQTASTANTVNVGAVGSTTNSDNVNIDSSSGANTGIVTIGGTANTSATGILEQVDGITDTFTGAASNPTDILKTINNSTGAFQVKSSGGSAILNVDTTDGYVDVAGSLIQTGLKTTYTSNTYNGEWVEIGACTLTTQYTGCSSDIDVMGGLNGTTTDNSQTTIGFRTYQQNAMGSAPYVLVNLSGNTEQISASNIVAVTTTNTGSQTVEQLWAKVANQYETWYYTPELENGNLSWTPQSAFQASLPAGAQTVSTYNDLLGGSLTIQGTNSSTIAQVQNADGESVFQAGTTAPTNYITDGDFANGVTTTLNDWSEVGSPSTFTQNTTAADTYDAQTSLKVILASASEGFETPGTGAGMTSEPTTNNGADEYYTLSFEAMQTAGTALAANTFTITGTDSSGNQTCTGLIANSGTNTLSATGFETVYCTLQFTSGTAGSISQVEVQTSGASGTIYFGNVQLQLATSSSTAAAPSAYQEGTLDLRGVITNPIALQAVSNSTTAFQVQNASGSDTVDVDTLDGRVGIGTNTPVYALDVPNGQIRANSFRVNTSGGGLVYDNSTANAAVELATTGTTITRNEADASPTLIVYNQDASNTGNILDLQNSSGNVDTFNTEGGAYIAPNANSISLDLLQNAADGIDDVFDVQGSNGTSNFIQVTSTAANSGAVNIAALGANTLSLQSGGGINIDTNNVANTLQIGNTANAVAQTIDIGNNTTASSTDTLNLGSLVGTSATTIQAGTGNLALNTGTGSGTTGSISIATGNSSAGNSGNVSIDTGSNVPSGTTLIDDNFEGSGSGSADGWVNWFDTSSVNFSNTFAHLGSYSLKIVETATTWGATEPYDDWTVVPGDEYKMTMWVKSGNVAETLTGSMVWDGQGSGPFSTVTDSTSGWTEITVTGVAPAGVTGGYASIGNQTGNGGSGDATYVDDVVVQNMSTATVPNVDVGATNAQAVTLGNVNELGVTTVQGGAGGVNISGASGATVDIATSNSNSSNVSIGNSGGGTVTFNGTGNSALQLQNSDGESILQAGTISSNNYITDGDFANGSGSTLNDWTKVGSPTTYTQNTTAIDTYDGSTSLQLGYATGGSSQGVETYAFGGLTSDPTTNNGADEYYTVSFEAMEGTGGSAFPASDFTVTGVDSVANATCTGTVNGVGSTNISTSGFEQVYCTLQYPSGTAGSLSQVEITSTTSNTNTFYIDDVQLQLASSLATTAAPSAYQEGTLELRGVVGSPLSLQGLTNSTTAFQVQNSTGYDVAAIDTLNGQLDLGSSNHVNGSLVFNNSGNTNQVSLSAGSGSAAYNLTLPTTAPSTSQCLESGSSTAGLLQFVSCAGSNLQGVYNSSNGSAPTITLNNASNPALTIQNTNSSPISGTLFGIYSNTSSGLGSPLFTVASTGDAAINTTDTAGNGLIVTGNSITTGNVLDLTSSSTGLTTGSIINASSSTTGAVATNGIVSLQASGNYTSTSNAGLLDVYANSTNAGTIEDIQGNKLTTGTALDVTSVGTTAMTTGSLLNVAQTNTTTGYTGSVVNISGSTTTGIANVLNVSSANTSAGNAENIAANGITSGNGLNINSTSTGLTSGSLLTASSSTTGAVATNGIVSLQASGNYTSTSNAGLLDVYANTTAAGTVEDLQGNALTTGVGLDVTSSGTGLTSGSLVNVSSATTGAVATNGVVSLNATGNYTSTSNAGLLDLAANSTTAGTIENISGTGLSTGTALNINAGAGKGLAVIGSESMQTSTNTTTASLIQNSVGATILGVGTSATVNGITNYISDSDFNVETATCAGTTGLTDWTVVGAPTDMCQNTTAADAYIGSTSMELVTTAVVGEGASTTAFTSAPAYTNASNYTVSFYVMQTSGTALPAADMEVLTTVSSGTAPTCTGVISGNGATTFSTSGFQQVNCTLTGFTASGNITGIKLEEVTTAEVATMYIDDVQLQTGTLATGFVLGNISLRGVVNSPSTFQNTSNSNTAFQIQNNAGSDELLVDTLNNRVAIAGNEVNGANFSVNGTTILGDTNSTGAFGVVNGSDITAFSVNTSANDVYIGYPATVTSGTTTSSSLGLQFQSGYWNGSSAVYSTYTIQNAASTTGSNYTLNFNNNSLGNVFSLNSSGAATFQNTTNSASATSINNTLGTAIFQAGTSASTNYITDSDIVAATGVCPGTTGLTDWTVVGAPTDMCQNTTAADAYEGATSMELVTTATVGEGASTTAFTSAPAYTNASNYTVSFYVTQTAGTALPAADLEVLSTVSSGTAPTCTGTIGGNGATLLSAGGFEQVNCTLTGFTASGNITGIKLEEITTAEIATMYIDAIQLQSGTVATAYQEGTLALRGVVTSPVALQNTSNSTSALQVQNVAGSNIFSVDTLDNYINIGTAGGTTSKVNVGGNLYLNNALDTETNTALDVGAANANGINLGNTGADNIIASYGLNTDKTPIDNVDAFQIQSAVTDDVLQVGTTMSVNGQNNYINDPDFSNGTGPTLTDWTKVGSPTTYTQNTSGAYDYEGITSLELTYATGGASQGVETASSGGLYSNPTTNNGADEYYTVSFEAMEFAGGSAFPADDFTVTAIDSSGNQTCTGTIAGTGTTDLSTAGFEQIYCTLQFTSGTASQITQLEITSTTSNTNTFYLDDVQLQLATTASTTATPSAFDLGSVDLRGVINNPVALQNSANSTTAFQIENSAGSDLVDADTLDSTVNVTSSSAAGNGLSVTDNALTTGNAVNIASTSALQTAGSLFNDSDTATLATLNGSDTGSVANFSRSLTANVTGSGTSTPTLDNSATFYTYPASTTQTDSFTINAGYSNYYLVVGVFDDLGSTGTTGPTVTYNGVSLTKLSTGDIGTGTTVGVAEYGLASPATGTNNLVVSGGSNAGEWMTSVSDWYNVGSIGTVPTQTKSSTANPTITVTTVSGDVVEDFVASTEVPITPTAGQTEANISGSQVLTYGPGEIAQSYKVATTTSTVMSWSETGGHYNGQAAIDLKGATTSIESVTGAVASFSDNCTITSGTCNDTGNVVSINQQYTSAAGTVLQIQNSGDGMALKIQNGSGASVFTVNTKGAQVIIGNGDLGDSSPVLLTLDNGTSSSDPAGIAGSMYYNSTTGKFRCYLNGIWQDCVGLSPDNERQTAFYSDDFYQASTSAGNGIWTCAAISAGTLPAGTGIANHPGIDIITSSTTANSGYECGTGTGTTLISGGETFEYVFDPLTFTNTTMHFGFMNSFTASLANNAVMFTVSSTGVIAGNDINGGALTSVTCGATAYTLSTANWYRARITVNPTATSATFTVYNAAGTLLCTGAGAGLPTTALGAGFTSTDSGTSTTALDDINYMAMWYSGVNLAR